MRPSQQSDQTVYGFGPFRLFPGRRLLLEDGRVCPIGSRALELLLVLLERAGEVVLKNELLGRAWPDTFVHEANLRVNIVSLRKVLGDGQMGRRYIINHAGQGYAFVAPVARGAPEKPGEVAPPAGPKTNLPPTPACLLGRAEDLAAILVQVPARRCVTLAGPGGVGKTTVALAAAHKLLPAYDDGVWFIDLSPLNDPDLIPLTIATALGISFRVNEGVSALIRQIAHKRLLLVLDNCEHVVEAAAQVTEQLLTASENSAILATSRETLNVTGEWVYWLAPMSLPAPGEMFTAASVLSYPAVRLFADRAASLRDGFTMSESDARLVVEICRALDGLPLAIELAAARLDLFELPALARILDDPFVLQASALRSAQPRQQSLMRTLEWSFQLLSPMEQTILRRLSIFRGSFTLAAAEAVAGEDVGIEAVYPALITLSEKSLLESRAIGPSGRRLHRMLHVTRSLLRQKLDGTTEKIALFRRHALYMHDLLAQAESDWMDMTRAAWLELYGGCIEDTRGAMDWAFSACGDAGLGIALTALALPLGFQLSIIDEFKTRVERALLHARRAPLAQPIAEMRLNIAFDRMRENTSVQIGGHPIGSERASAIAATLPDAGHRVEPLIARGTAFVNAGEHASAVKIAREAAAIGLQGGDPMAVLAAERILAQATHFQGDHAEAERLARGVIDHPAPKIALAYNSTPVDRHVSMNIVLARIAWLQGRLSEADLIMQRALRHAQNDGAFSICPCLAMGSIPIALWNGDHAEAAKLIADLHDQAARYTLGLFHGWADLFTFALRADTVKTAELPRDYRTIQLESLMTFLPSVLTPDMVLRLDASHGNWCGPEILRMQAAWLMAETHGASVDAESLLTDAVQLADAQGALMWKLRAGISLARLWVQAGHEGKARVLLEETLAQISEPKQTADIKEATMLLASLGRAGHAIRPARMPRKAAGRGDRPSTGAAARGTVNARR